MPSACICRRAFVTSNVMTSLSSCGAVGRSPMAGFISFKDTVESGSRPSRTFPASIDEGRPPKPDDFLLPHFLEGQRVIVVVGDFSLGGGKRMGRDSRCTRKSRNHDIHRRFDCGKRTIVVCNEGPSLAEI
jgi:hypothetical protein